jgi:hypothetical protein
MEVIRKISFDEARGVLGSDAMKSTPGAIQIGGYNLECIHLLFGIQIKIILNW